MDLRRWIVALVLFGPKKLPELGKTIGKAITEFRRAQSELKSTFDHHMRELERENESIKEVTQSYTNDINNHMIDSHYDSPYYDSGAYGAGSSESTAANSTTVSEPAPQGAETPASQETVTNGTVPRTTQVAAQPAPPVTADAEHAAPEVHPNGHSNPESQPVNS